MKRWRVLKKFQDSKTPKLKFEEIIKTLLNNRGLKTKKQIQEFLFPPSPYNLPASTRPLVGRGGEPRTLGIKTRELNKSVRRIKKAIAKQESIIVYSDFDADGICGGAILWETLNSLGAKAMPYIPDRIKEGYGLSKKGIDQVLKEYDAKLIITVDQGITAKKEVAYAKKKGIETIVTDHHLLPKKLPSAVAIVHTTLLSGSAVAWVLAQHLIVSQGKKLSFKEVPKLSFGELSSNNSDHLALAAIGTIADLIPLVGPSRSIVKYGLQELNKTKRIGLKALFKEIGIEQGEISTYHVGFMIAPRINAMGRIGHAIDSLRLLCTNDLTKAKALAQKLNQTNRDRQKLMTETTNHAKELLKGQSLKAKRTVLEEKLIFLSHDSYHEGVIGLVAGKLTEEFYRPAIVISRGEKISKASARSIKGFNIVEAMRTCADLLVDCGGHPMAAGFTVETKNLAKLQSRLEKLAVQEISQEQLSKTLKIDCEINLTDVNLKLYEKIKQLTPFGMGNREPVFATRKVTAQDARLVGRDQKHLKLTINSEPPPRWQAEAQAKAMTPRMVVSANTTFNAIAFSMADFYPKLSSSPSIDIAYNIILNEWNGRRSIELKIKDIKIL
ncbi:single-stranded-DNA-specific exonuclease RecJ [Candidatus Microgenomates bacterium]|nr:single-stranded-DNA-specific exonuclease RecJ [Candidatus Microgenomates bacterium]